jgi:hypothetical protein
MKRGKNENPLERLGEAEGALVSLLGEVDTGHVDYTEWQRDNMNTLELPLNTPAASPQRSYPRRIRL